MNLSLLPIVWLTITKTFGKRVRSDLQLRDPMVLIGGHADEFRFSEGKRSKCLSLLQKWIIRLCRRRVNAVNARLIAMHRIQNDLECSMESSRTEEEKVWFDLRVHSHRADYWSI